MPSRRTRTGKCRQVCPKARLRSRMVMFIFGRNFFMQAEQCHDSNPLKREERDGLLIHLRGFSMHRRKTSELSATLRQKFSHPFASLVNRMRRYFARRMRAGLNDRLASAMQWAEETAPLWLVIMQLARLSQMPYSSTFGNHVLNRCLPNF